MLVIVDEEVMTVFVAGVASRWMGCLSSSARWSPKPRNLS